MHSAGRLQRERLFHDRQASERRQTFVSDPGRLRFTDDDYLDHESWIRPAIGRLGEIANKDVLDFGCGHGMAAVMLARQGARVTAFDLSSEYVVEARSRAVANQVKVAAIQADGQRLPFADASFDAVWANAVLHHLDVAVATKELHRVLRPSGVAVVCEPWGENPLLRLARWQTGATRSHHSADEQPLRRAQLRQIQRVFAEVTIEGFQLAAMARPLVGPGRLTQRLEALDRFLITHIPAARFYCRYVVLSLRRAAYNTRYESSGAHSVAS